MPSNMSKCVVKVYKHKLWERYSWSDFRIDMLAYIPLASLTYQKKYVVGPWCGAILFLHSSHPVKTRFDRFFKTIYGERSMPNIVGIVGLI